MHEEASLSIIVRARDEAAQILQGISGHLGNVAKAAAMVTVVGVALAAGIAAASIKMAGDFQDATEAIVTGAGEDVKNLELIRQGLLRLAPEVGKTPKELAEGLYFIESAGYHGAQGLDVLRASAIAAKVGEADMATVSDALTSALNAYHLPAQAAFRVTDQLLATVAAGKMHMSDLAGNIGKVLPVAAIAHVSLGEVGAAMATMTSQGTDASMATTSLRFLLMAMINPTSQAADALKNVGLSAKDLFNALQNPSVGLHGALQMITEHINKRFTPGSQEAVAALANIVGGTRGMTAALELSGGNMKTFTDNIATIGRASTGTGRTMEGWKMVQGDFNQEMDRFRAAVVVAGIEIGNRLLPAATQMVSWAAEMLPKLVPIAITIGTVMVQAIMALVNAIQILVGIGSAVVGFVERFRGVIIALAAVITTLMLPSILRWAATTAVDLGLSIAAATEKIILNSRAIAINSGEVLVANARTVALAVAHGAVAVATGAWTAATWLLDAALSANPIGLVVIAIALLVAGLIFAYTHSERFRTIVQAIVAVVMVYINVLGTAIRVVADFVGGIIRSIQQMGGLVGIASAIFTAIPRIIQGAIMAVLGFLGEELPQIPYQIGFALGLAIGTMVKFAADIISWAASAIPAFLGVVGNLFSQLPGLIWSFLVQVYPGSLVRFAGSLISWASTAIPAFVNAIGAFFSALPGRMWAVLQQVVANDIAFGGQIISWAGSAIPAFVNAVVGFISALPGRIWSWLQQVIGNLGIFGGQMSGQAANAGNSFVNTLVSVVSGLPGRMLEIGRQIVQGIWNGIQSLAGWLRDQVGKFVGGIISGIKAAIGARSPATVPAIEIGEPMALGIAMGVTRQAPAVHAAIRAAVANPVERMTGGAAYGGGLGGRMFAGPVIAQPMVASGGRDIVIPVMIDGKEIGRAVMKEVELIRKLRGGGNQMAAAAG